MFILLIGLIAIASAAETHYRLYQHPADRDRVLWSDKEKGGQDVGVTIYRSIERPGYYRVSYNSDTGTESTDSSQSVLVRPANQANLDQLLAIPVSYCTIWNDIGMQNLKECVQIWEPQCPDNFVALGAVSSNPEKQKFGPNDGDIYCVNKAYTTKGDVSQDLTHVWGSANEAKVEVDISVSVAKSNPDAITSFALQALVPGYEPDIYFLNKNKVGISDDKPIKSLTYTAFTYSEWIPTSDMKISGADLSNALLTNQDQGYQVRFQYNETLSFYLPSCLDINNVDVTVTVEVPNVEAGNNEKSFVNVTDIYVCDQDNTILHSHTNSKNGIVVLPHQIRQLSLNGKYYDQTVKINGTVTKEFYSFPESKTEPLSQYATCQRNTMGNFQFVISP